MTVTYEDLLSRLRTVIKPGESAESLLQTTVDQIVSDREAARLQAACARAQEVFGGSFRPHEASMASAYQRLGLPQRPPRSADEIEAEAEAEALLVSLPPEKTAELERLELP